MPRFSIFTPLGHLRLSRQAPIGQRLFDVGRASIGGNKQGGFVVERGNRTFAWLHAWAMTAGSAQLFLERASKQWDPAQVTDMLEVQEHDRGSIPLAGWTIGERRAQLQRMRRLIQDVSANGIESLFLELLPDAFLAYLPTSKEDAINWPTSLGDQPQLLALSTLDRRIATLTSSITTTGASVFVNYAQRSDGIEWELEAGDVVVIEPENPDRAERVTLINAFDSDGGPPFFLQLVASKPHAAGVSIIRAPWPMWTGSKRHSLVILTAEAGLDSETRRLAQWLMERVARGTSTWDVIAANPGNLTAGPFTVGGGLLGATTIGLVTL